jgi:hypothetical protein
MFFLKKRRNGIKVNIDKIEITYKTKYKSKWEENKSIPHGYNKQIKEHILLQYFGFLFSVVFDVLIILLITNNNML